MRALEDPEPIGPVARFDPVVTRQVHRLEQAVERLAVFDLLVRKAGLAEKLVVRPLGGIDDEVPRVRRDLRRQRRHDLSHEVLELVHRHRDFTFAFASPRVATRGLCAGNHDSSCQLFDCRKKASGLSNTTLRITSSACPRRFISWINAGTASGSDLPQSPAELAMIRSPPTISMMSDARSGVHFVVGYSVMAHQKPLSSASRTVCSSTWSIRTRCGLTRLSPLSMSTIMRVPLYLSSRRGVWMRISSSVFMARSTCSWKMVASLRVFLF